MKVFPVNFYIKVEGITTPAVLTVVGKSLYSGFTPSVNYKHWNCGLEWFRVYGLGFRKEAGLNVVEQWFKMVEHG